MTTIRRISVDRLDVIEPLWCSLNELHRKLDSILGMPERTTTWDERREQLRLKGDARSLLEIAETDGFAVGYCFSSIDESEKGEIDSLFVLPDHRGEGLGRRFVENALGWMKGHGCSDIHLRVHPGNTEAIAFYWSFGFVTDPVMKKMVNRSLNEKP
jgi:ribosomal protein S18 acetylase RimI-like enzyme